MRALLCSISAFLMLSLTVNAQTTFTVKGIVCEDTENSLPIPGAAVMISGSTVGTITDTEGKFSIPASEGNILVFSALGYSEARVPVTSAGEITVRMKEAQTSLDEVVVIGYGTQAKSDLTGSVGVVSMDDILSPNAVSADQALQGRVAGVDIVSSGGEPGEGASIRVRGTRSISASNDPLIVVDGVINAVDSFSDINPEDIKTMTVLKDVSATAIYGSRGSNGVILVTTKGGEGSKLRIVFDATLGLSQLPKKLELFDASEFAQWRNDYMQSYANIGTEQENQGLPFPDPSIYGKGTDWQEILTQKAFTQKYRLQLSQGGKKQQVYFSLSYDNQPGIVLATGMQRLSGMFKYENQFVKWGKAGIKVNYTYRRNDINKIAINGLSSTSAVCLSPLIEKDAIWNRYSDTADSSSNIFNSPYLQALNETNYKNTNYLTIVPWVEFTLAKGLSLRSTYSMVLNDVANYFYSPSTLAVASYNKTGGTASYTSNKRMTHLSETTLTWDRTFARKHKINIMAGFTAEKNTIDSHYTKGVGYADDNVGPYNLGGLVDKRNLTEESSLTELSRMSVLSRLNYSFKSRYFFTLTARGDGSSVFAEGNKWAFFPAAAFKWSISNEPWMAALKSKGISNLSLRLSAGRSGNDALSSYMSQAAIYSGNGTWLFGDNTQVIAYPKRLGDPTLTWEKTDAYNIGIDISLLRDRITMSLEGYQSFTKDLLLEVRNAHHTGYESRFANVGSTRGWGLEYSIDSRNIVRPHFTWKTNFTISHASSTVTDIGYDYEYIATYTKGSQMVYGYKKGYSANALWGYQFCGVWHNEQEKAENEITRSYVSYSYSLGNSKYADINHDGVLDKNDMVYLGTSDPVVYGGLNNTFKIYNFDLGIYFTYSIGGKIYNISEFNLGTGVTSSNKYKYMVDAWHPTRHPDSDLPSAKSADSYASSRFVYDSSFLRLKTLSLSYRFDLSKKISWLRDLSLGVNMDNLFLVSGYRGYDPDVSSSKKVQRLDNASYPNPRSYSFTLKIRY